MRVGIFPVQNDDRKWVVFGILSTADWDPRVLPKWSNQISARSVNVPFDKAQLLPLKLTGLLSSRLLLVLFHAYTQGLFSKQDTSILDAGLYNTVNNNEEDTETYILYPYYTLDALYNSAELKTCFCHAWSDIYKCVNILYTTVCVCVRMCMLCGYVCVCACVWWCAKVCVVEPAPHQQWEAQIWLVSDMKRAATHKRAPVHLGPQRLKQS